MVSILNKIREIFFKNTTPRLMMVKNFTWLFTSNVSSRFLKGIIIIYAARKLGASEYGVFSYAFALASFFVFFKNIGVDAILTREVAKKTQREGEYFSTSFWIEIGLLIVTAFLIMVIAPFFSTSPAATLLLPLVAFMLIFDDLKDLFVAFFRGKEQMEREALVLTTSNIALAVLGFLVLSLIPSAHSFTASYAAASLSGLLIAALLLRRQLRRVVSDFNIKLVPSIFNSAWPFALSGIVSLFMFSVDIILLGWWRSTSDVGLYAAAQKMVGILAAFSALIAIATFPALSRLIHEENTEKSRFLLENILRIIFVFAIPLVVGGLVLRSELMAFIFGKEYASAATAFGILLLSILATHPMSILANILFAFDKQRKQVLFAIIASFSSVLLNLALIRSYGIEGAALATTVTGFIYAVLLWNYAKTLIQFEIASKIFKILLAAGLMGLCAYLLKGVGLPVLLNVAASGLFYFAVLYFSKEKILQEIINTFQLKPNEK